MRPTKADRDELGNDPDARLEGRVYDTDRGIDELMRRRGAEQVSVEWLADRLRDFVDRAPEFETAVDRLASFLARLEDDE
jgi:hypothetical protein